MSLRLKLFTSSLVKEECVRCLHLWSYNKNMSVNMSGICVRNIKATMMKTIVDLNGLFNSCFSTCWKHKCFEPFTPEEPKILLSPALVFWVVCSTRADSNESLKNSLCWHKIYRKPVCSSQQVLATNMCCQAFGLMDEMSWQAANNTVISTGNLHSHQTVTFLTSTYFQWASKKSNGYITRVSEP